MRDQIQPTRDGRYQILKANELKLRSFLAWYSRMPADARTQNWRALSQQLASEAVKQK